MALRSATPALALGGAPRVNLMPRAAIERRQRATLLRQWVWVLAATLLVIAVVSAGAYTLQAAAQQRLDAENARTSGLLTELAGLQPVRTKLALQTDLTDFRSRAMGTDIAWAPVIAEFTRALPDGLFFEGWDLSPGGLLQGDDPAAEIGLQGDLLLTGGDPRDMAPLIRSIRALPGVLDADGWTQSFEENRYHHVVRVTLDQSVYTGAFAMESDG